MNVQTMYSMFQWFGSDVGYCCGLCFCCMEKLTGWVFGLFCLGTTAVLSGMVLVELGFGFLLMLLIVNGLCVGYGC